MDPYRSDTLTQLNTILTGARSFHADVPWLFPSLVVLLLTVLASSSIIKGNGTINVPTVPPPTLLSRIVSPYRWLYNALALIMLGMDLHGRFDRSFKTRGLSRWYLFITKPHLIDELRAIPQSTMSFRHALDEQLRTDYSLSHGFMVEAVVPHIVKKYLSDGKSLARSFSPAQEEHRLGWGANIPSELQDSSSTAWVAVDVIPTLQAVITRTSNRIFFGVELARNEEFRDAMLDYTVKLITSATSIDSWPQVLQPLVSLWVYAWKKRCLLIIKAFLGPVIEERRQKLLRGAWKDRPYDSIHFPRYCIGPYMTHLIYDLAGNSDLQPLLREEIESSKESGVLTYAGLSSCSLLDSVIKESSRLNGVDVATVRRRCMEPYTFSDGTNITTGTWVMAPASAIHRLPSVYPNPNVFDGFRFKNLRSTSGKENDYQFVQTSAEFLAFGHGTYACPGRFFAGIVLKVLAAELILNYEWRFRDGKTRPENGSSGMAIFPGPMKALFRRLPENS